MSTKLLVILIAFVAFLSLAGAAYSLPGPNPPQEPQIARPAPCILSAFRIFDPAFMPIFERELKLDEAAKAKVKQYLDSKQEECRSLVEANLKATKDFAAALAGEANNTETIISLSREVLKSEQALLEHYIKMIAGMKELLNPEQSQLFTKMLEKRLRIWTDMGVPNQPPAKTSSNMDASTNNLAN